MSVVTNDIRTNPKCWFVLGNVGYRLASVCYMLLKMNFDCGRGSVKESEWRLLEFDWVLYLVLYFQTDLLV